MKFTKIFIVFLLFSNLIFAQNQIKEIDSLLKTYTKLNQFNGNLMVIKNGETIYKATHQINNPSSDKLNEKTIFPIASLSKSFTALVILKLQEEQKLSIEDQLSKYLPDYPNGEKILIKHLLSHGSGIYELLRKPKYIEAYSHNYNVTPDELLAYFKNEPLDFNPGEDFSYSNSGYVVLGVIIEKITQLSYEEAIKKYILKPLRMKHTGYNYSNFKGKKTKGYEYLSQTRKKDVKLWNGTNLYATGGLYSNLEDLRKFYLGLINNKIITQKSFDEATTVQNKQYGWGWFIDTIGGDKIINHGGNMEGFTSHFMLNTEKDIAIIALNNITSNSLERISNTIYKIITDKPYSFPKPKMEVFPNENTLKTYVGTYDISEDYIVSIKLIQGNLYFLINKEKELKLSAESESKFFIQDENILIEFIKEENNKQKIKIKIKEGLSTKIGDQIEN